MIENSDSKLIHLPEENDFPFILLNPPAKGA